MSSTKESIRMPKTCRTQPCALKIYENYRNFHDTDLLIMSLNACGMSR